MLKKFIVTVIGMTILFPLVGFAETIIKEDQAKEQTSTENFPKETDGRFFEEETFGAKDESETTEGHLPTETVEAVPEPEEELKIETGTLEKETTIESSSSEEIEDRQEVLESGESVSGTWGTVPWTWDSATKTIKLEAGNAGTAATAPWKTYDNVEKIVIKDTVVFPSNSEEMFGSNINGINIPLKDLEAIVNAGNIDVSSVTNMQFMFSNASSLTELDVSSWDVSSVTNMGGVFSGLNLLTELDVSSWNVSSVTNMSSMFTEASSLTGLDVSNWDVSSVTNMHSMFASMHSLTALDISSWDVSNVTNMRWMFIGLSSLTKLDVSSWDVSSVKTMDGMFNSSSLLTELDVSSWDVSSVTDMSNMFYGVRSVTALDVSSWDVSSVTDMSGMFALTRLLTELDVSSWDVSSVTNMSNMFIEAALLTELDVSDWDVSSVTNMSNMFYVVESVTTLDVSKWNVSSVTDMSGMFTGARLLTELDVSSWDVSSVTDMSGMFTGARLLTELDVSSWDVSSVTNMERMFNSLYKVKKLNISSFNMQNVTTMRGMFTGTKLEKLILGSDNKFIADADLGVPFHSNGTPAEKWIRINGTNAVSPTELMNSFGNGDLIAGTYIAEKEQLSISHFDPVSVSIGDEVFTSFNLDLNLYPTTIEKGAMFKIDYVLPVENIVDYDSDATIKILDSDEQVIESLSSPISQQKHGFSVEIQLSAEQLSIAKSINLVASGKAWNNTSGIELASLEVHYPTWGGGDIEEAKLSHKSNQNFEINNGSLQIRNIPDQLNFDIKKLSSNLNGTLIDLKTNNFVVSILDFRGTNAISKTDTAVARQDWEMFLTAEDFVDQKNNIVDPDTMSLVYVKNGENQELLSSNEVLIESHSVQGETAKENHLHEISWKDEEGLKVHVKNKNNLKAEQMYQSTVIFELRQAP